ncbi:MAG: hypothetical protein V1872_12105 [bacterium]
MGNLDILQAGQIGFLVERHNLNWSFEAETLFGLDYRKLRDIILSEDLEKSYPYLKGVDLSGESNLQIKGSLDKINLPLPLISDNKQLTITNNKYEWQLNGKLLTTLSTINFPNLNLVVSNLKIDLPINLASSSLAPLRQDLERQGLISFDQLSWKDFSLPGLILHPSFSLNRFRIPEEIGIDLLEGKAILSKVRGDAITSSNRSFYASLGIENMKMHLLSGQINGKITDVLYKDDRIELKGSLDVKAIGGELKARGLYIEKPLSIGRKFGGNLFWDGVQLELLTDKIPIGKISGVIKGTLTGLVFEYGQPASFSLEVESVKQKGIKQKISVDAINNLSVIGTGSSGVGTVLNSGLNRFFSYYPYSRIGFRCELENDVFSLQGLIHQEGREYIIRKGFFRGIDMVNQNPNNTISFKDMKERINRIFEKREGGIKVEKSQKVEESGYSDKFK